MAEAAESGSGQFLKLTSIGLPVLALIGAGMVKAKPEVGVGLLAASAVGFILALGFNFFTLIPVVILGLAALLGLMSTQEGAK